jgi:autotransporter-associated beta strand protein
MRFVAMRHQFFAAAVALAAGPAVHASTWDGGGSTDNFSDPLNWTDDLAPVAPLVFDGTTRLTPFNDVNTSAVDWAVTFPATAGAFTIQAGPGTTTGGAIRIGTVTNSSDFNQRINPSLRLNGTRTIDTGSAGITLGQLPASTGTGRVISKNGAGALTVAANGTLNNITFTLNAGSVEFANTAALTDTRPITGAGNVLQSGAGTTVFTGANGDSTYTGTTSITNGTLLMDANHTGAGDYTVGANGALGGIGAINLAAATNAITVNGTLVPGSATAIQSLDIGVGDLTLAGAANFQIDLAAATFDEVNVGDLLTYGGVLNVAFSGADGDGATFDIFDFAGFGGAFSQVNFTGLAEGQTASFDAASGVVTVDAVPEPGALALLGFATLALTARHRRARG